MDDLNLPQPVACLVARHDDLLEVLRLAPVEFDTYCRKHPERLRGLGDELESLATAAVRLAGYVKMRHGFGYGDQGHAKAVRESNKFVRQVRKVFGYNVTRDVTF